MAPWRHTSPLISEVELQTRNDNPTAIQAFSVDPERKGQPWYNRLPLLGTISFILAPQPSFIRVLIYHHWRVVKTPTFFVTHLLTTTCLTLMAFTSLLVCVARDPGPVKIPPSRRMESGDDEDIGLAEALMGGDDDEDFTAPGKWCRKCWAPKPERAHHCSVCGRCVMKMDHHCPWLGSNCVGHRTYPSFIHFLTCCTILAIYIATVCIRALMYSFRNPYNVDETTPVHELVLALYGMIVSIVIGPFAAYHYYLVSTNQTTIEHISPFLLLRHLPPLPRSGHSLSDPPLEPELSYKQRTLVRDAHGAMSLYDIGFRKNWAQVCGWEDRWGWVHRILYGGSSPGSGDKYPRNPRAEEVLAKLARELVLADRNFS